MLRYLNVKRMCAEMVAVSVLSKNIVMSLFRSLSKDLTIW
jgi:hypothetical protein